MRIISIITVILCIFTAVTEAATKRPSQTLDVYFEGTDYELHVHSIYGRRPGKTVLILGGIQGDEPGGFLSADSYTNLKLEQGNLIIMPRANLKSIMLNNRESDGRDMNRLFLDDMPKSDSLDYKVVAVIIDQMKKSDLFLNLHDGWGFHNPKYIDKNRNPKRFGQSVIVDDDTYKCSNGTLLDLKSIANKAITGANKRIDDPNYHLVYFNTMTDHPETMFKEMQKTATWYALRNFCIPAFAIEASKNITSVEQKVLYHNYAINEFLRLMDVIPENPPIYVAPAKLDNALVTVNGESHYVSDGDVIAISKSDMVSVKHIETNYPTGVTCDILGIGNLNDIDKELAVNNSTKIIFRKDNYKFAEVTLQIGKQKLASVPPTPKATLKPQVQSIPPSGDYLFDVTVDGKRQRIKPGDTIRVAKDRTITLHGLLSNGNMTDVAVNLRGWVATYSRENTGDDRNYTITVSPKSMLARFSINNEGKIYPITVDNDEQEIARIYIEIVE